MANHELPTQIDPINKSYIGKECPNCHDIMNHYQRDGDMLAPDADWFVCPNCGYETDPE